MLAVHWQRRVRWLVTKLGPWLLFILVILALVPEGPTPDPPSVG